MSRLSTMLFDRLPPALSMRMAAWKNFCSGERELRELKRIVPRDRISIDVGAHRGVYTYHLARLSRGVIAYEPNPHLADYLRRAFGPRITVRAVALGGQGGPAQLAIPIVGGAPVPGWAKVVAHADTGGPAFDIEVARLDEEKLGDVGFIKIDVEGNEEAVLAGGTRTILRDRPVLLVEIEQRHLSKPIGAVFAFIHAMDYRGYFLRGGRWMPVRLLDDVVRGAPGCGDPGSKDYINNFLFWPDARGVVPWLTR